MSDYTRITDFTSKDALPTGNPSKAVLGAEIEAEFDAIATAVATKANSASPTFTGTPVINLASITSSGDLPVSQGGTGASTAVGAMANLGYAVADLTFTSVLTGTADAQNWAHGLGTDDVDFGCTFKLTDTSIAMGSTRIAMMGGDGRLVHLGGIGSAPSDPDRGTEAPATGNIRVAIQNGTGSTISGTIYVWARKRS